VIAIKSFYEIEQSEVEDDDRARMKNNRRILIVDDEPYN
jgi:hypothetical protein